MMTTRQEIRMALSSRNQAALAVAIGRHGDEDEALRIASDELASADVDTRSWWEEPQAGCDGTNCSHDHELVGAIMRGLLE